MVKYRKSIRSAYGLSDPLSEMNPRPIIANRAPVSSDTGFPAGQVWIHDAPANDVYMLASNGGGAASWTVLNAAAPGSAPFSKYTVDADGTAGYTTIQSALDAANAAGGPAVIVIRPAIYTEDLTLYSGISLMGTDRVNTIIVGKHTPPTSGNIVFSNLFLQSTTDIIESAAAGTTNIFVLSSLFATTSGYIANIPSFTGYFVVLSCNDFGSTNNGVVNMGAGVFFCKDGTLGAGTVNVATCAGTNVSLASIQFNCPMTISGAGTISIFGGSLLRGTLTLQDTVSGIARNCSFATGTDIAIVQNSFGSFGVTDCTIDSSAPNVVTGVGIFQVGSIDFVSNDTMSVSNVAYTDNILSSKMRIGTQTYPVTSIASNDAVSQVFASDGTNMGNSNSGFRVNYEGANGCVLNECEGIRSNVSILTGGNAAELHGGYFGNTQNDGSTVSDLLCAVCAETNLLENDVADQPSFAIAAAANILLGADGIDSPTADFVASSVNLLSYHDCFNATGNGVIVSRDPSSGTGTTANSAFKVKALDPTKTDWNFGLDLYDGLGALPYGTSDIKLWDGSYIKSDGVAVTIQAQLGEDVNVQLGDVAGANKLNIYSSTPAAVAYVDSTGTGVFGTVQCTLAPINVDSGGTGLAAVTQYAMLYGDNVSPLAEIGPLTDGQLIIGSTGNAPVAATLTAGAGIGITPGAGTITITNTAFSADQINIFYVGKHGNDANDGKSIGEAKLTFGSAILAAVASDAIVCFDGGLYTETLTDTLGVTIFAPDAGLKGGGHTLTANSKWTFGYSSTSGATTTFTLNSAGAFAYLDIKNISSSSTGPIFDVLSGRIFLESDLIQVTGSGGLTSLTSIDRLDITAKEIITADPSPLFNMGSGFRLQVNGGSIYETAPGATLINNVAPFSSYANMTVGYLEFTNLSNITGTSTAYITASEMAGTLLDVGAGTVTGLCSATNIDGAVIGSRIPAAGTFTTLGATLTQHGVLVGAGATSDIQALAVGTNGQVLIGSTGNAPVFATLASTGGTISYTPGAGTLNLDVTSAGTAQIGGVELATNDEVKAATDTSRAIVPSSLNSLLADFMLSGRLAWGAGTTYYTVAGTNFTVDRSGTGYIKSKLISWAGAQTLVGLSTGSTHYVYMDNTGTIGSTTARTISLYQENIVLFEVLVDPSSNVIVVREDHQCDFQTAVSEWAHDSIGIIISNKTNGANIALNGTKAIQINGADQLLDHGLNTVIPDSAAAAVNFSFMYTNGAGKWVRNSIANTFPSTFNSAGTPTALTAGKYGVFRLYVSKDDLNSSTPTYYAVMHTAEFNNLVAANAAIGNGTIVLATNEFDALELAQLGYVVKEESTDTIVNVVINKSTANSVTTGAASNSASLINTSTAAFDGWLSAADTTVQAALNTLDEIGKGVTPQHAVLVSGATYGISSVGPLTDGQVLIGSTGVVPVAATLTAGTGISVTPGAGSITIANSMPYVDESNIIYVGKHGNDANDGLTIQKAKLTFGAAITAAAALIGDGSVVCFDQGTYTENIVMDPTVRLYAPNAQIIGTIDMAGNGSVAVIGELYDNGSALTLIDKTGTGYSYLTVNEITLSNAGSSAVTVTNGYLVLTVGKCQASGGLGKFSTTVAGNLIFDAENIEVNVEQSGTGSIRGSSERIAGAAIISAAGSLNLTVGFLVGGYDVSAGTFTLIAQQSTGLTNFTGGTLTKMVASQGIDNVPIGAITAAAVTGTSLTASTGDIEISTAGSGLNVKEGANARMGVATLVGGTLTVNTTEVTANSRIFLTHQNNSGTPGFVTVSARVASTSFTITSSNAADTSDIAWLIVEPA